MILLKILPKLKDHRFISDSQNHFTKSDLTNEVGD